MQTAAFVAAGYLCGSLTFGYWLVRIFRGEDIRTQGSGNIGASNVWRVHGRRLGIPAVLLDSAKGFVPAFVAVELVEASMSSPIYELLKRPDELFVVEHAHLQPRFVEDSVRVALKSVLEELPTLANEDFVLSRQLNFETIHAHEVVAERYGTIGELRAELDGGGHGPLRHTELRDWLRAA